MKIVDPRVLFGPSTGENVHLNFEVRYGIKEAGSMNYVLYDAIKITTNFNFEISEEVLLANFITMDVAPASEPQSRKGPIYADIEISEEQYSEYWLAAEARVARWYAYLNEEVFGYGVPLPYLKLSYLTKLDFKPHAVIAVVSLFYN